MLVVLTSTGMDKLANVLDTVQIWKKSRVAVPLVMTKAFIENSLDCYPIEFLNMQQQTHFNLWRECSGTIEIQAGRFASAN